MTAHHRGFGSLSIVLPAVMAFATVPCRDAGAQGIRTQAVVNLTFDEPSGDALDSATAGKAPNTGVFVNGPARIRSPFWNQSGKQALALDAGSMQSVRLADSPDLDRADALSISLLFANLNPDDDEFHTVFVKRGGGARRATNYGLTFGGKADRLNIFFNDLIGFKVAQYGVAETIPPGRGAFITATFEVGDAPAPDADEERDDLLVRFYVNGQIVKPKGATGGQVVENDVWLIDVSGKDLPNDGPLDLGGSFSRKEYTFSSCVIDEFSLFDKALSSAEVAGLFTEVAGDNALATIAAGERAAPVSPPGISSLSTCGLQTGSTTVLTVTGRNLLPDPQLVAPFAADRPLLRPGATADRAEFEIVVPASVAAGHYSVRIQNANGVSGARTIAIDPLPQVMFAESSPTAPVALPVAISGVLSGQQLARVFFRGTPGQHLVADLECRRLGSGMDPVLELRNPRLAPIAIAWGRPQYNGDTRIEATLTEEGIYSLDLHDLAYKASGKNHYRLKVGDLKIVDSTFPPAVSAGTQQMVAAIGPGMGLQTAVAVDMDAVLPGILQPIRLPAALGTVGPAPIVVASEAVEILETAQPEGQIQAVDARFDAQIRLPIAINGRLMRAGETDRYRLQVRPGTRLSLAVESHDLRSPLDPHLAVVSVADSSVIAVGEERPEVNFTVPEKVSEVDVVLGDLNHRGGPEFVYRLQIARKGLPEFSVSLDTDRVTLARDGSALLRVDVNREGYNGPVLLNLVGAEDLSLTPSAIPAGVSKALVVIAATGGSQQTETEVRRVQIVAQSQGVEPALRRVALTPLDTSMSLVPTERVDLTAILFPPAGGALQVGPVPPVFFRGTELQLPVSLQLNDPKLAGATVRLSLVTTEKDRTIPDPGDERGRGKIRGPVVHNLPLQLLQPGERTGNLRLAAPAIAADPALECVVRAELVPNAFASHVISTVYSSPFRLNLHNAVSVQLSANALALASKLQTKFAGTLRRTPGFVEPVVVQLVNLPKGYTAPAVTVAPEQESFEIVVTAPEVKAPADLPNIEFRVTLPNGSALLDDVPIPAKVTP